MKKVAVVAVGGNSLITDNSKTSMMDQLEAVKETCRHLADLVLQDWTLVVTHGNGPQVGFGLRRCELGAGELPVMPMEGIGAETQGNIGYMIQQCLKNELHSRGVEKDTCTIVTQTAVDANDPAFKKPSKPVGSFMDEATAKEKAEKEGWNIVEDAGRGWRRVVPSPLPMQIIEEPTIKMLVDAGLLVISTGGGGIPVVKDETGAYHGVAAVIDKDYASALLASNINADLFIISTAVEKVALNFGKPNQINLDNLNLAELKEYSAQGHFAAGSMGPKINAVINFLENGGQEALITCPEKIMEAVAGKTGTRIRK